VAAVFCVLFQLGALIDGESSILANFLSFICILMALFFARASGLEKKRLAEKKLYDETHNRIYDVG
jgi:hypothetical protein